MYKNSDRFVTALTASAFCGETRTRHHFEQYHTREVGQISTAPGREPLPQFRASVRGELV